MYEYVEKIFLNDQNRGDEDASNLSNDATNTTISATTSPIGTATRSNNTCVYCCFLL